MNAFYNPVGISDTLMIMIKEIDRYDVLAEIIGDVVRLTDKTNNEVIGYNILNASTYGKIDANGQVKVDEAFLRFLQEIFKKNKVEDSLEVDLSPKFVVGYVEEKEHHPNADKLSICKVNVGDEVLQIVCGAPNVAAKQKVVVAKVGAVMPSGMLIKEAKLRGVDSYGMICSAKELNLPNAPQEKGILVLDESAVVGKSFTK